MAPFPFKNAVSRISLAVAALTFLVFCRVPWFEFMGYDDPDYVFSNPVVQKGLSLDGIRWALTTGYVANWHPLTWISHMLDCTLFGVQPGGPHLVNVLIHASAAVLLFLVLQRMTGKILPAAFVAAVFAVHPLRVESVAWISERKDVLAAFFFTATLAAYYSFTKHPHSLLRYLLLCGVFAMGLMSKPVLVTMPFLLLLLDYWPLHRLLPIRHPADAPRLPQVGAKRILLEKIPLLGLAIASSAVTVWTQSGVHALKNNDGVPVLWRLGNAAVSYVIYIRQLFWPSGLAVFYPHHGTSLPLLEIAGAGALLIAIFTVVLLQAKRRPYLLVGWFWYLGMLVPMIGIIQMGSQAHADRYTYLPQIGLLLMVAWGAEEWVGTIPQRRLVAGWIGAAVTVLFGLLAFHQTRVWKNTEALWIHTLDCTEKNDVAENGLGKVYADRGLLENANRHYRNAVEINPKFALPWNNLGVNHFNLGKTEEAIAFWQKAVDADPTYAEAYNNLSVGLFAMGRIQEGVYNLKKALELEPANQLATKNFAILQRQHPEYFTTAGSGN